MRVREREREREKRSSGVRVSPADVRALSQVFYLIKAGA